MNKQTTLAAYGLAALAVVGIIVLAATGNTIPDALPIIAAGAGGGAVGATLPKATD